jgi:hypothetical protein
VISASARNARIRGFGRVLITDRLLRYAWNDGRDLHRLVRGCLRNSVSGRGRAHRRRRADGIARSQTSSDKTTIHSPIDVAIAAHGLIHEPRPTPGFSPEVPFRGVVCWCNSHDNARIKASQPSIRLFQS